MSISKLREFLPWILAGSLIVASFYLWYLSGAHISEHISTQPDSIKLCGTFEAPGETPGSIIAEDFQMVITKDGAMIDPGPEDRVKLRICEEGK